MLKSFVFVGNTKVGASITESLTSSGFEVATDIESADAVVVYCETQADIEDVFFDSLGLVQRASKGTYLINLSSSTPEFARELNAVSIVNDLHTVEAPLMVIDPTVEKAFADSQNLSCFVAGEDDDIEAVSSFLNALAGKVRTTGASGSAQLAQAALTIQKSAQIVACMETEALYRALSASSETAIRAAHEEGMFTTLGLRVLNAARKEQFIGDYTIQMWMAELAAALMAADDSDLILPSAEACMHLLELLVVIGGSDMTPAALSLVYGDEALCAKHGLDWTRADAAYSEEAHEHHHDGDCDHHHDDFPGGFGTYSSN